MSALAEALVAAQRRSLATLEKAYVAEQARWDEAQDEALRASADRFERGEERES